MATSLNDPATLLDLIHLTRYLAIEIAAALAKSSREADEALINIANNLLEQGRDPRLNERDRTLVSEFAAQLIRTEPGAEGV